MVTMQVLSGRFLLTLFRGSFLRTNGSSCKLVWSNAYKRSICSFMTFITIRILLRRGLFRQSRFIKTHSTVLRCRAFQLHQISMLTSQALILYVQVPASFTSWETTYGYRPVCPICWKIAR